MAGQVRWGCCWTFLAAALAVPTQGHARQIDPAVTEARQAVRDAAREGGARSLDTAAAFDRLAALLEEGGQQREAEPLRRQILLIVRERLGDAAPAAGDALSALGANLLQQELYAQAEAAFREAIGIAGADPASQSDRIASRGEALLALGRTSEAEEAFRQALKIDARSGDAERTAASRTQLANVLVQLGRIDEAGQLLAQALTTRRAADPRSLETARTLDALAAWQFARGGFVEAEALYREALQIRSERPQSDEALIGLSLANVASALAKLGRLDDAEAMLRRSLAIAQARSGQDSLAAAERATQLSFVLQDQRRFTEAEPLLHGALAVRVARLGEASADTVVARNNLAFNALQQGRFAEAAALLEPAIAAVEADPARFGVLAAAPHRNLGLAQLGLGRVAAGYGSLRRADEILARHVEGSHPDRLLTGLRLAEAELRRRGDYAQALARLRTLDMALRTRTNSAGAAAWASDERRRRRAIFTLHVEAAWRVAAMGAKD